MTPHEFIEKWKRVALNERQAAQGHFYDLCRLLDHPDPITADPSGEAFCFEKGAPKTGGGDGFADVWKRGHFAWEYKKKRRNLDDALKQLVQYASALENPPLLVACDTDRFKIVTAWTNTVSKSWEIGLDDLEDPDKLAILRAVFHDPEKLRPARTRQGLTREAADKFSTIAMNLQGTAPPEDIAHFVNQLVFCFFASAVRLLPEGFFPRLLKKAAQRPQRAKGYLDQLFAAMERGGEFDLTDIAHFNGGLFDGRRALALDATSLGILVAVSSLEWDAIDPTIFGTLFERFLDPDKRAQIGAHYTDPAKIMLIIEPVVLRPLQREWAQAKAEIAALVEKAGNGARSKLWQKAEERRFQFLERLRTLRILDPACGSGNFLYLALQHVKDLELRANRECEILGLAPQVTQVGPEILRGIEINPMAAELARTTIWIGDIQWGIRNGIYARPEPILRKLDAIECRDALVKWEPAEEHSLHTGGVTGSSGRWVEAEWPDADFIVGNPPFLGGKLMLGAMGEDTVRALRHPFQGRLSEFADLVCYWFEKANRQLDAGLVKRVGFVATNSIRGGANRRVLDDIKAKDRFIDAWSDEPWVIDGASVRVSIVCFGERDADETRHLNGAPVREIHADLTASETDLTLASRLDENLNCCFEGGQPHGPFDLPGTAAREWLVKPLNVNGRPNSDVLKPYLNARDVVRRASDRWIIEFPAASDEKEIALYEAPFEHAVIHVKNARSENKDPAKRELWWRHHRSRPALRAAVSRMS